MTTVVSTPSPPRLVAHADWSIDPRRRWMCVAHDHDGRYVLSACEPVGPAESLLDRRRVLPAATIRVNLATSSETKSSQRVA